MTVPFTTPRQGEFFTTSTVAEAVAAPRAVPDAEPTHEGRTARGWAEIAEAHAVRAAEAYEVAREVQRALAARLCVWLPLCDLPADHVLRDPQSELRAQRARSVPEWVDEVYPQVRAAFRRIGRRSAAAHTCDCRARSNDCGNGDVVPDVSPERAAQWARRAQVLADACEADARAMAEAIAWNEAEQERADILRRAEYGVATAEEEYKRALRPNMWKDEHGRKMGTVSALRILYTAREALAAVNGEPFLAVPDMTDTGTAREWHVVECSPHSYLGTVTRIVHRTHTEQNAETGAYRRNREREYKQTMARMRADMAAIDAVWADDTGRGTVPVSSRLWGGATNAAKDADRALRQAERERGTGAAERCAPLAERVADARRTVEEYAAHRAEAVAQHTRQEAERREAARAARAVPDAKAAEGRDPMGPLPGAWNEALRDVAREQVHTNGGEWQRVTRGWPGKHRSQRALSALLALGLIIEAEDVTDCRTAAGGLVRIVTLSRAGVARFDRFGTEIPERARSLALLADGPATAPEAPASC
ncbi:hypothetical protein [Streptomyces anthocyanicus]|uniref:hypothetical protein n=1 Tax=Streptomyces anthocyanicus TaxID=68174 RepID=UPI0038172732